MASSRQDSTILIVDDDAGLRADLVEFLSLEGFVLREAGDAATADKVLADQPIDAVVLDVKMPGEDGFHYIARLRSVRRIPVLMLSGEARTADRVHGLDQGADDYLTKPFDPVELAARLRALLRRGDRTGEAASAVCIGLHVFDLRSLSLTKAGHEVPMPAGERALLKALAENPRQLLTRAELLELLGDAHGERFERSVDVRVTRLRARLGDDPAAPRWLHTVRGQGYRFTPDQPT